MFVVVVLFSIGAIAQEKESGCKFHLSAGIDVGTAMSHSAHSLFRGLPSDIKTNEVAFEFGISKNEKSRSGILLFLSGYYTDNLFKEDCSLFRAVLLIAFTGFRDLF